MFNPYKIGLDSWLHIFTFCEDIDRINVIQLGFKSIIEYKYKLLVSNCSQDQKDAIRDIVFTSQNLMIIGGPGTGKTYTIKLAQELLEWCGLKKLTCSSTGVAAINANGATICRSFTDLQMLKDTWNIDLCLPKRKINPKKWFFQILFVDEISMVDPATFEQMVYLLRDSGIRICLVGDFRQLPPVLDKQKLKKDKRLYLFESKWMDDFKMIYLKTNHRQVGQNDFLQVIDDIGKGQFTSQRVTQFVNKRKRAYTSLTLEQKTNIPHLYHKNESVDAWNKKCFDALQVPSIHIPIQIEGVFQNTFVRTPTKQIVNHKTISLCGQVNIQEAYRNFSSLQETFKQYRVQDVTLKIGCLIMFTKNMLSQKMYKSHDSFETFGDIDIVNGTQAKILDIKDHGMMIQVLSSDLQQPFFFPKTDYKIYFDRIVPSTVSYYPKTTLKIMYHQKFAKVIYYPCVLCYAMTVHKSQGLTLDNYVLSLPYIFNVPLAYVGISRAKKEQNIYIEKWFPGEECKVDPKINQFYTDIASKKPIINHKLKDYLKYKKHITKSNNIPNKRQKR